MTTATITVGRNVGGEPMGVDDWLDFQDSVEHAVWTAEAPVYFKGPGYGWSRRWGAEEAFTVVCEVPADMDGLMRHLALLCGLYGQEAVAVTVGEAEMLSAEPGLV